MVQNLMFMFRSMVRMALAAAGRPNWALLMVVFHLVKVT
jgi:hypothetical protein